MPKTPRVERAETVTRVGNSSRARADAASADGSRYSRPIMLALPDIGSSLPDVVLRTAVVYLFLIAAMRISGKREVGQMSVLELVVILVISDAVQNSMIGENTTLWGGLVAVVTLLSLDFGIKWLADRSRPLKAIIEGEPRLLVRDGRLLQKALREEKIDAEDVRAAIRSHGLARVDEVRLAVLETDGSISVIPLEQATPTPSNRPPDVDAGPV